MNDTDDDIEQLSMNDHDIVEATSRTLLTGDAAGLNKNDIPEIVQEPPAGNKGMARVVAITGIGFLLVCFMMVGISLTWSKNIDSIVRNSNEMLRKHNDRMTDVVDPLSTQLNDTGSGL